MDQKVRFSSEDLLLVVDVQNDFCPGGALGGLVLLLGLVLVRRA